MRIAHRVPNLTYFPLPHITSIQLTSPPLTSPPDPAAILVSDHGFNRELMDESEDIRACVELLVGLNIASQARHAIYLIETPRLMRHVSYLYHRNTLMHP